MRHLNVSICESILKESKSNPVMGTTFVITAKMAKELTGDPDNDIGIALKYIINSGGQIGTKDVAVINKIEGIIENNYDNYDESKFEGFDSIIYFNGVLTPEDKQKISNLLKTPWEKLVEVATKYSK